MTDNQKTIIERLTEAQSIIDSEAHAARGDTRETLHWASDQIDQIIDELTDTLH